MYRKYPLATGGIYHIMNKSIAGFQIYNREEDYQRMQLLIRYFTLRQPPAKFSHFLKRHPGVLANGPESVIEEEEQRAGRLLDIIAYSLMPTHVHIAVRQTTDDGISHFMRKVLNGYTRYFNTKYKRQGPLWMGRFKNVPITNDEQLLHVTRYIHLNSTTASLVKNPGQWPYSSYHEYVNKQQVKYPITRTSGLIDMSEKDYRRFCEDHISYQKELAIIKHQILD